jgi:hypothetical protein
MELIRAGWKITLGGVALLEPTDYTDGDVALTPSRRVQVVEPIRAAFAVEIPRGNIRNVLSFERFVLFPNAPAARLYMATHAAALAGLASAATCTMQLLDGEGQPTGNSISLANAVIEPDGFAPEVDQRLFRARYQIGGGATTVS